MINGLANSVIPNFGQKVVCKIPMMACYFTFPTPCSSSPPSPSLKKNPSHSACSYLRSVVLQAAAHFGNAEVIQNATEIFKDWMLNNVRWLSCDYKYACATNTMTSLQCEPWFEVAGVRGGDFRRRCEGVGLCLGQVPKIRWRQREDSVPQSTGSLQAALDIKQVSISLLCTVAVEHDSSDSSQAASLQLSV